jgi:beta-glucosidase
MNTIYNMQEIWYLLKKIVSIILPFIITITYSETLDERITNIINQMSLEEKIAQLHREGDFNTPDNTRLDIPGFVMADGPHGVRSGNATCFPVGIAMAASWDINLVYNIGVAMGKEFKGKNIHQALGPCMDICRDPRNGRSPESGGEDPFLCAQITTALIRGIQSSGCIATAKHFNCVNRQTDRVTNNVTIDQRMLMEHYGLNFRTAVQKGLTLCVMNSYNLINGDKCAENAILLTDILRDYWGFPFYVVSDWWSIWDSEKAIKAGCNICMGSFNYQDDLLDLVQSGNVSEEIIDDAVRKVLRTKILSGLLDYYPPGNPDDVNCPEHQQLSLEAGRKCMVLLKNEDNILPINKDLVNSIALIGPSANVAQLDGQGSSTVVPFYTVTPREGIENKIEISKISYTHGCDINSEDTTGFAEARNIASTADIVVFIGGLDATQEGEGQDRISGSIALPGKQQELINELALTNSQLIVVLISGGICGVNDCIESIKGLLYAFYPGQEGGNAIADVLFGDYNPGGKLPVSMPQTDSQLPEWNDDFTDDYGCGYRWFDQMDITPQFAFGYGLSYTTFSYSNLSISPQTAPAGHVFEVSVDVTNTGSYTGDEVVQLYLTDIESSVYMPEKQLKGFKRISLQPAETRTVHFTLTSDELYYYEQNSGSFKIEAGVFNVKVGGSSDNLPLSGNFEVTTASEQSDLIITSIKIMPPYPAKDDSVVFLAVIKNQGTGPTPSAIPHEVLFRINGSDISWSTEFLGPVPAGGMAFVCADGGPAGSNAWIAGDIGKYSIEAIVDHQEGISECIEDNNIFTDSIEVISPMPVYVNIAHNKPVTVSSVENTGLEGEDAVDGDYFTRWSSLFNDPQYIYIDLEGIYNITHVILFWETGYGKEYTIDVSDDASYWTTIKHETNSDGDIDSHEINVPGRYIRMYGIQRGTPWGYSLYEFEVYGTLVTGIDDRSVLYQPDKYMLGENYPNPFNVATIIPYYIKESGNVKINIYNITGQLITTLVNKPHKPGNYKLRWDGKDTLGNTVPSGIYFYRIETGSYSNTKKMLMIK